MNWPILSVQQCFGLFGNQGMKLVSRMSNGRAWREWVVRRNWCNIKGRCRSSMIKPHNRPGEVCECVDRSEMVFIRMWSPAVAGCNNQRHLNVTELAVQCIILIWEKENSVSYRSGNGAGYSFSPHAIHILDLSKKMCNPGEMFVGIIPLATAGRPSITKSLYGWKRHLVEVKKNERSAWALYREKW